MKWNVLWTDETNAKWKHFIKYKSTLTPSKNSPGVWYGTNWIEQIRANGFQPFKLNCIVLKCTIRKNPFNLIKLYFHTEKRFPSVKRLFYLLLCLLHHFFVGKHFVFVSTSPPAYWFYCFKPVQRKENNPGHIKSNQRALACAQKQHIISRHSHVIWTLHGCAMGALGRSSSDGYQTVTSSIEGISRSWCCKTRPAIGATHNPDLVEEESSLSQTHNHAH